ncbi:MAG: hypothetical protein QM714_16825 [Nocardioides sp.]|uniref:hypothetical protein n=1 Tax=Nocardioides sp. TaxID=35761 RepID=UPI0039E25E42
MTYRPVITSQADLERVWRHLMQPLGFSRESLWFMFLDSSGAAVPQLTQLEQAEEPPDRETAAAMTQHLAGLAREVAGQGGRVAFLRSRPGGGGPTARDRSWANTLAEGCREADLPCEVFHLATDHDIIPMPYDELIAVGV